MTSTTYRLPHSLTPSQRSTDGWKRLRDLIMPSASERLEREASQGRPIHLGTVREPYESISERHAALAVLANYRGLSVTLLCRNATIAEDLALLGRIDRDHALTVVWHLDAPDPLRAQAVLGAAAWFSAHGLATELRVTGLDRGSLDSLVRQAAEAGVGDVQPAQGRMTTELERLRLVHGLPRAAPVRG